MIPMNIRFAAPPVYPDLKAEKTEAQIIDATGPSIKQIEITAVDGGMGSGRPSVMIRVDLPDGRVFLTETSARLFCSAARAVMAKYPKLFEGGD